MSGSDDSMSSGNPPTPDGDAGERLARLERRLVRERAAREEAERIAESGMRDLWHVNRDLEARVAERTAELERSLRAATMAAQAKERFLAELGHELTTPLHAVLGLLELIDPSTLGADDRERLAEVRRHSSDLSGLLRGLVELAGAEGEPSLDDVVERDASAWLDEVVESWTRPAAGRGQLLVPSVTAPSEPIRLDWRRLRRIVDAVLANVTVHAAPGSVSIDLVVEPQRVALRIEDSGPGMSEDELGTAREPFVGHGATAGVGIGLSFAHRLAVSGGGSLGLASDGSTSTIVEVSLPVSTRSRS